MFEKIKKYLLNNLIGLLISVILGVLVSIATGWVAYFTVPAFVLSYLFINFDIAFIVKIIEPVRIERKIKPNEHDKFETLGKIKIDFVTDISEESSK